MAFSPVSFILQGRFLCLLSFFNVKKKKHLGKLQYRHYILFTYCMLFYSLHAKQELIDENRYKKYSRDIKADMINHVGIPRKRYRLSLQNNFQFYLKFFKNGDYFLSIASNSIFSHSAITPVIISYFHRCSL